jgi:CcmD family protein
VAEGSLGYLFAALAIIWLVIVGYLVVLGSRLSALQRELDALKRRDGRPEPDEDDA